jgi:hypothetical protein
MKTGWRLHFDGETWSTDPPSSNSVEIRFEWRRSPHDRAGPAQLDQDMVDQLKALGYVDG